MVALHGNGERFLKGPWFIGILVTIITALILAWAFFLSGRVVVNEATLAGRGERIAALETNGQALQRRLDEVQARMDRIQGRVESLEPRLERVEQKH